MSPALASRIALLGSGQRHELERVLQRLTDMGVAGDLDEHDIFALVDEIQKPLPPPTSVPVFEVLDALALAGERRRLRSLLEPIAARCGGLAEFVVSPLAITDVPGWAMARVKDKRRLWYERFEARGRTWDPND